MFEQRYSKISQAHNLLPTSTHVAHASGWLNRDPHVEMHGVELLIPCLVLVYGRAVRRPRGSDVWPFLWFYLVLGRLLLVHMHLDHMTHIDMGDTSLPRLCGCGADISSQ